MTATLCLTLIGALLLQLWRPWFHLTDDNLAGYLPIVVEACQRLWAGHSPFTVNSIFGGDYNLLRDAGVFTVLSPYVLATSFLANTDWYYAIPDVVSTLNLITIAGAFCWSALHLRKRLKLEITNGWIVFLSLSYAFTPFNILVGSSWIGFLNPQVSYPLVVVGLLHPDIRKAAGLIGAALLYGLFGGHIHPFLFLLGFSGTFAMFVCRVEQSWQPLIAFIAGGSIAFLCALPVLIPAFSQFSESPRSAGVRLGAASELCVPPLQLAASFTLGAASSPVVPGVRLHMSDPLFNSAIAFAIVNVPLLWVLCRKRKISGLEVGILICIGLSALLIVRPRWLAEIVAHLPLFRSLRWPFREVAALAFFAHILMLLNLGADSWRTLRLPTTLSAVFFILIFFNAAPTFNPHAVDRELVISGRAKQFWTVVEGYYGRAPRYIVSAPPFSVYSPIQAIIPYTIMGSYNYAGLMGGVNISGYSPVFPPTPLQPRIRPIHHWGGFFPQHAELLCAKHPDLVHVSLVAIDPPKIEVSRGEVRHAFVFDPRSRTVNETPVRAREKASDQQKKEL